MPNNADDRDHSRLRSVNSLNDLSHTISVHPKSAWLGVMCLVVSEICVHAGQALHQLQDALSVDEAARIMIHEVRPLASGGTTQARKGKMLQRSSNSRHNRGRGCGYLFYEDPIWESEGSLLLPSEFFITNIDS